MLKDVFTRGFRTVLSEQVAMGIPLQIQSDRVLQDVIGSEVGHSHFVVNNQPGIDPMSPARVNVSFFSRSLNSGIWPVVLMVGGLTLGSCVDSTTGEHQKVGLAVRSRGPKQDGDTWTISALFLSILILLREKQRHKQFEKERIIEAFRMKKQKTIDDFVVVIAQSLSVKRVQALKIVNAALHYGAPFGDVTFNEEEIFDNIKEVTMDICGASEIISRYYFHNLRGRLLHHFLDPFDAVPKKDGTYSRRFAVSGMFVAYMDEMRGWMLKTLSFSQKVVATEQQKAERVSILVKHLQDSFYISESEALRIIKTVLRLKTLQKIPEDQSHLFKHEISNPMDEGNFAFYLRVSRQAADFFVREAAFENTHAGRLHFKAIVVSLLAKCGLPVPGYSMLAPVEGRAYRPGKYETDFREHDWVAVLRLREAIDGPLRLPWEEDQKTHSL